MQKQNLGILKLLFFLSIGALLIWLALRNLTEGDKENILKAFNEANYYWVMLIIILSMLSHISRAVRWKIALKPLGYNPKLSNTIYALMVGYFANLFIPRMGEVSRCGLLAKYENIPFSASFGTVIAERFIDLICLATIFLSILYFQFDQIWMLTSDKIIAPLLSKIEILLDNKFVIIGVILTILVLVIVFKKLKSNKNGEVKEEKSSILKSFADGFTSIKDIEKPFLFLFHTLFIWTMYTASIYVCFFCFLETSHLKIDAAFAVLVFSTVGVIFVPGGTGLTQVLVTETLTSIFKISFVYAFAYAWLMWTIQYLMLLIIGLASLGLIILTNKEVSKSKG